MSRMFKVEPIKEDNRNILHMVVVTYNRLELLKKVLERLLQFDNLEVQKIHVVNNASTDGTRDYLDCLGKTDDRLNVIHSNLNLGGAGGFKLGLEKAIQSGADWVGLLDDDVLLDIKSIGAIRKFFSKSDCLIGVREDLDGNLVESASLNYDLKNPMKINPNRVKLSSWYQTREKCPEFFPVICASFEGFFISKKLVYKIGSPTGEYFIYGDDFDYSLRVNISGSRIYAVRDAVIVRLLPYSKEKYKTWKAYYIWRNFFVLHFLYGENVFVKVKPCLIAIGLSLLKLITKMDFNPLVALRDAKSLAKELKPKVQIK